MSFEYNVVEVREKLFDDRGGAPTKKLASPLNERGRDGWQLKQVVSSTVAGVVGKREGFMIIFERGVA